MSVEPCTIYVTLTFLAFSFLMVKWNNSSIFTGFLWRLNEKLYIECLAQYLEYSKCLLNEWQIGGIAVAEEKMQEKKNKEKTINTLLSPDEREFSP